MKEHDRPSLGRCLTSARLWQARVFSSRGWLIAFVAAVVVIGFGLVARSLHATATANVQLSADHAGPREVEDTTEKAIVRDYGAAWQTMSKALEQNRPDLLGDVWVGVARNRLAQAIDQQKQSGVSVRYIDHGHKLDAVFYSPEGSALELHDTAQLERQVLDGGAIVDSQNVTEHYLVVMTPTSDHWQVRIFQSVPGF